MGRPRERHRSDGRRLLLASGRALDYEHLVLATGARPRVLPLPGAELAGVHTLRRRPDALALLAELRPGSRLCVIGGGWIGLEVAAAARARDCHVTVLEGGERPLGAILGPLVADHFAALHRAHGVDLRTRCRVEAIEGVDGRATGVRVDGVVVAADVVLMGVGAIPNVELAQRAGLPVDGGILADERLRTADPAILAMGDVARAHHVSLGPLRVEHWDNAIRQGELAAATILGEPSRYDWQPYFFTDQYDLGMEYVGHADAGHEVVLRGDPAGGEFVAFWLDGDVLRAAMNVNVWDVNDTLRGLVGGRVRRTALADERVPLTDLAA